MHGNLKATIMGFITEILNVYFFETTLFQSWNLYFNHFYIKVKKFITLYIFHFYSQMYYFSKIKIK